MEVLLGLIGIGIGIYIAVHRWRNKLASAAMPVVTNEKPGHIYFLENQKSPGKIKILKQQKELITPMRIVCDLVTPEPGAVLNQIYRDLEGSHISQGWYDGDAVRMYLDHLKGEA